MYTSQDIVWNIFSFLYIFCLLKHIKIDISNFFNSKPRVNKTLTV